jgi:hypothetical protein
MRSEFMLQNAILSSSAWNLRTSRKIQSLWDLDFIGFDVLTQVTVKCTIF